MNNCIFCKIAAGDIPAHIIYEDDVVISFVDLSQATTGHVLIIPKTHVQDIFDLSDELAGEVFKRVPRIARAIEKAFPTIIGLNVVNNNREGAGQSVFHSHIHLIPRYEDDDFEIKFIDHSETADHAQIAEKIKEALAL
ncbi:MAG: HIT family protein [Lactobacillales bacterium]|jgi:histidine triad (HIT) family protein|nr:HIT family protein [Lactobacillales bacterium]